MTAATKSFTWHVMVCSSIRTQKLCMQAGLQHSSCFTSLGKLHSSNSLLGLRMYPSIHSGNSPEATGLKVWRTKSYRMVEFPLRLLVSYWSFFTCLYAACHACIIVPCCSLPLATAYAYLPRIACSAWQHVKLLHQVTSSCISGIIMSSYCYNS